MREETNTNPRAQQAVPPQTTSAGSTRAPHHSTSPVHCPSGDQVLSPALETHDGDLRRQILETHPVGG